MKLGPGCFLLLRVGVGVKGLVDLVGFARCWFGLVYLLRLVWLGLRCFGFGFCLVFQYS